MTNSPKQKIYEFEDFRLDTAHLLLYKAGSEIPLAPKVVETLMVLVENGGQVISKEELIKKVWADAVVEEGNLSQNLFRLRKILGETKDGKPFIETLRRRGFRFVPEVRIREAANSDSEIKKEETGFTGQAFDSAPNQTGTENFNNAQISPARNHPSTYLIGGFVLLAMAISIPLFLRFGWQTKPQNTREIKFRQLTKSGNLYGAAISPDGNSFAYVLLEGKNSSLRLKNISTESEVVVVAPSEATIGSPRFSPDGNFIYYSHPEGIFQVPVYGGDSRKIASNPWSEFSVSPDGTQVAFPRGNPTDKQSLLVIAQTNGSREEIIARRTEPDFYEMWGPAPVWSPDGEHLTVVAGRYDSKEKQMIEINLHSGGERPIKTQDKWEEIEYIAWINSHEMIISGRKSGEDKIQLWDIKFPDGTAERITNDFYNYTRFSLNSDLSKLLAIQETENLHLWFFDQETGVANQITSGANRADGRFGLTFAPDGQIIYTTRDQNNYDIFSINPDGADLRQLTKNAGSHNFDPSVSPDNRFIAFASDREGNMRVWLMKRDGTQAWQLTPRSEDKETHERNPFFSPDGKWIYYTFYQSGKGSIKRIPLDGGEPELVSKTTKNVYDPAVSPNGKFLAHAIYNNEAEKPWQISVMSVEAPSEKERFFNFPAFRLRSRWMPDSRSLISINNSFDGGNLWQTNLESGERKQLTNFTTESLYHFDISRDGRFFVVSRGNYFLNAVLIER